MSFFFSQEGGVILITRDQPERLGVWLCTASVQTARGIVCRVLAQFDLWSSIVVHPHSSSHTCSCSAVRACVTSILTWTDLKHQNHRRSGAVWCFKKKASQNGSNPPTREGSPATLDDIAEEVDLQVLGTNLDSRGTCGPRIARAHALGTPQRNLW